MYTVRNVLDIVPLKGWTGNVGAENTAVIGGGYQFRWRKPCKGREEGCGGGHRPDSAPFDYDMVQMLHKELLDNGVSLIVDDGVKTIEEKQITLASGKTVPADAVILAIGVAPETGLAAAGLEIGETGGILVDHNYRTSIKYLCGW